MNGPTIQNLDMNIGQNATYTIGMLPVVDITSWQLQCVVTPLGTPPTFGSQVFPYPYVVWQQYLDPTAPPIIGPPAQGSVIKKNNLLGGSGLIISNGPAGQFQILFFPEDTNTLQPGVYEWNVWRIDSGNFVPISRGYLYLYGRPAVQT